MKRVLLAVLCGSLVFFSCKNAVNAQIEEENQETDIIEEAAAAEETKVSEENKKAYVSFSAEITANRSILPSEVKKEDFSYELSGILNNVLIKIGSWDTYESMSNAFSSAIELEYGEWTFILNAKKNGSVALTDTVSKSIEVGTNSVSFGLDEAETGNGSINVTLSFPKDAYKKITAALYSLTNSVIEGYSEETLTINQETAEEDSEQSCSACYGKTEVPAGNYFIKFYAFQNESDADWINIKTEYIHVAPENISTGTLTISPDDINTYYTITYETGNFTLKSQAEVLTQYNVNQSVQLPSADNFNENVHLYGWYDKDDETKTYITGFERGTEGNKTFVAVLAYAVSASELSDLLKNSEENSLRIYITDVTPTLSTIKTALRSYSSKLINLDLSGCTGLTSIANFAFQDCSGLTGVTIPDSVTSIGTYAFSYCTGLTSITIPDSVTSIDNCAFQKCTGLTKVNITDINKWCGITFGDCYSNPLYWAEHLYLNDTEVINLVLDSTVTRIGSYAFYYCTGLTSVTIPDSITSIGSSAFRKCTGLTKVNITDINKWCAITFGNEESNPLYYANHLYLNDTEVVNLVLDSIVTSISSYAFYNCTGLTSVTIPDSVASIDSSAFSGCAGLTTVTIGTGVTSIGYSAFYRCTGLTKVNITDINKWCSINFSNDFGDATSNPLCYAKHLYLNDTEVVNLVLGSTVTSIGSWAFCECTDLTSVTIPDSVTSIGSGAFYNCTGLTSVTIPSSVTSIANFVFEDCSGLTSVTIPDSVTSIGSSAFSYCTGLTSVTIPDSVTSIDNDAFYRCTGLTKVNITDINKWCSINFSNATSNPLCYAKHLYLNDTEVINLVLDSTVTSIGSYAFYKCTDLTSVTIPGSVTSIGDDTFYGCAGLTTVTIGTGVTSIGSYAFYNCTGLTSVTIPDNVTSIGASAFSGCSSLEELTIPFAGLSKDSVDAASLFGAIFGSSSYSGGVSCEQYYSSSDYKTYYIPSTLKSVTVTGGNIGYGAFYGCTGLTSVTISDSVTSIGSSAFSGCTGITSITIPDSVTSIGDDTFSGCAGLTAVTIGTGVTSIGSYAFSDCTGLTSVTIPDSVTSIGSSAFSGCAGLTAVTIGTGVTSIGSSAFSDCTGLTGITIPDSVASIDSSAFSGCTGLTKVNITDINKWCAITFGNEESNPLYYAEYLYLNDIEVVNLVLDSIVTSISSYAFYNCTDLTSITIPDSVTSIGDDAFYGCAGLTTVTIGTGVTSIGSSAFYNCTGLTSVTITDNVTSIGASAFSGCSSLEELTIPFVGLSKDSVDADSLFGAIFGSSSYSGGVSCEQYYSSSSYKTYKTYIPSTLKSVTVTGGNIGYGAFSGCTGLTSVTISDSVTSIGSSAFSGCSSLEELTIPFVGLSKSATNADSVFGAIFGSKSYSDAIACKQYYDGPSYGYYEVYNIPSSLKNVTVTDGGIGYGSFCGCEGLTSITIPDSVTSIGTRAFSSCSGLISITIPDSVISIGDEAFCRCTGLTSITIPDNVTSIGSYAFCRCTGLTSITIPDNVTSIDSSVFSGCTGLTSITIPDSVTSIGSYAFSDCTGLTNITIPDNVTSIDYYAFSGCTGLTNITIPEKVTSISNYAFSGCKGLTSIAIPDSVTSIGSDAFSGCTSLTSVTIPDSVTSIGSYAFYNCTGLRIRIPASVTTIGDSAFNNVICIYYSGSATGSPWGANKRYPN